jgi:mono/diheme cytochrome c family protein
MTSLPTHAVAGLVLAAAFALLGGCSATDATKGNAVRGEKTHETCLQCHGTEVYVPPQRKINSLPDLRKEVERWGDYYNPALSEQEIADLIAYLNVNFYKLQ